MIRDIIQDTIDDVAWLTFTNPEATTTILPPTAHAFTGELVTWRNDMRFYDGMVRFMIERKRLTPPEPGWKREQRNAWRARR